MKIISLVILLTLISCSHSKKQTAPQPDVIRETLINNLPQIRNCYQKGMEASGKKYSATLRLLFLINKDGSVSNVKVENIKGELPKKDNECIITELEKIRFPKPKNNGVIEISQPMNFYPNPKSK
ncbi:MAG: hypothetical protein EP319_16695 [Deltaproteobacteria bacterium]|nr:MAG: hypothetical protein EP319_16695 [Deltaproteobacteria bacterium]